MFFFDNIQLGYKNLKRRKARTFLTVLAISVGATLIFTTFSLGFGMKKMITEELEKTGKLTQIIVMPAIEGMRGGPQGTESDIAEVDEDSSRMYEIPLEKAEEIREIPYVIDVAPTIGVSPKSVQLAGQEKSYVANIDAVTVSKGTEVELLAGRNFNSKDKEKVIIGHTYLATFNYESAEAEKLIGKELKIQFSRDFVPGEEIEEELSRRYGDKLDFLPPDEYEGLFRETEEELREKQVRDFTGEIIGVSASTFEATSVYIPISWTEDIFAYSRGDTKWLENNGCNSILVTVDNSENVEKVDEKIKELNLSTRSFKSIFESILEIFSVVEIVLGIFALIALFVAAIGVINTMVMATNERTREIGVMRATGASKKIISRLFTWEAALIGLFGGIVGLFFGFLGVEGIEYVVNNYFLAESNISNGSALSGGARDIFFTPFWLPLAIMGFTTLLGLLAGLLPARHAANLDPVDALRYE